MSSYNDDQGQGHGRDLTVERGDFKRERDLDPDSETLVAPPLQSASTEFRSAPTSVPSSAGISEKTTTMERTPAPTIVNMGEAIKDQPGDRVVYPPKGARGDEENLLHRPSSAVVAEQDGELVVIPDGGWRAWLVVLGGGHVMFATFGFVNAWGVFQEYYKTEMFVDMSTSQIGWIGSLQYLLIYLPAVIMGRLVDTGRFYIPFWVGWALYVVSCFLTAEVKEYWQALLSHGVLFGLAAGIIFCPSIAVTSQWFMRRRALALGIVAVFSSIGGAVFPVVTLNCIKTLGFPWTMRICGFILLYCGIFASLTLRNCLPPKKAAGGTLNPAAFKDPSYSALVLGSFFIMAGLYTPLSYLDVMARQQNLGDFSSYLIAIANASSLLGRLGPALVADRVGAMNILIPGLIGSAVTTFAWPFATTKGALIAIAVTNGMCQGCYVSLLAPACAALGGVDDIGRRFGMVNTVMALGALLGAPVSGAILQVGSFHDVSYYAGVLVLVGCACFVFARQCAIRKLWGRI